MTHTLKDEIIKKYGTINNFIAIKKKELDGKLPFSREYIYKLIGHRYANPGIKSLNKLADLVGVSRDIVYKEYSE